MPTWLLSRISDHPDPHFALTGTANWMRALAILSSPSRLTRAAVTEPLTSKHLQRRKPQPEADTAAYGYLLMALHNLAALREFNQRTGRARQNTIRSAIFAWYYAVYECCSAMVLAQSGDHSEEHRSTARLWHEQMAKPGFVCEPFSWHLNSLVPKTVDADVKDLRAGNPHKLATRPSTVEEAQGAVFSYLKGTAAHERQRTEIRLRSSPAFKSLGVADFRARAARDLRDAELGKGFVNFLIQAFRYRGKANYRDSIYLSYGANWQATINELSADLEVVGYAFFRVAAALVRTRSQRGSWQEFALDIKQNFKPDYEPDLLQ